jgi:hypothetical protein
MAPEEKTPKKKSLPGKARPLLFSRLTGIEIPGREEKHRA